LMHEGFAFPPPSLFAFPLPRCGSKEVVFTAALDSSPDSGRQRMSAHLPVPPSLYPAAACILFPSLKMALPNVPVADPSFLPISLVTNSSSFLSAVSTATPASIFLSTDHFFPIFFPFNPKNFPLPLVRCFARALCLPPALSELVPSVHHFRFSFLFSSKSLFLRPTSDRVPGLYPGFQRTAITPFHPFPPPPPTRLVGMHLRLLAERYTPSLLQNIFPSTRLTLLQPCIFPVIWPAM